MANKDPYYQKIEQRWIQSKIPSEYKKYTFSKYNPEADINLSGGISQSVIQSRKTALETVKKFAKNIKENIKNGRSLILIGKSSTGKTVLGTLILKQAIIVLLEQVLYVNFSDLFYKTSKIIPIDDDIIENCIETPILLIDEIDAEDTNQASKDVFKGNIGRILTTRRLQKKTTVLTSRISIDEIRNVCGNTAYKIICDKNYFDNPIEIAEKENEAKTNILDSDKIFHGENIAKQILKHIGQKKDKTITADVITRILENQVV